LLLLLFLQPPPNKNIKKKMMQSAGGQTLSTTITKNLNPESGTEPAGTSHDEIGFQSCFEPANNEQ